MWHDTHVGPTNWFGLRCPKHGNDVNGCGTGCFLERVPLAPVESPEQTIVRELAERGPIYDSEYDSCQTCPDYRPLTRAPKNVESHHPDCLWRRARQLYPAPVVD